MNFLSNFFRVFFWFLRFFKNFLKNISRKASMDFLRYSSTVFFFSNFSGLWRFLQKLFHEILKKIYNRDSHGDSLRKSFKKSSRDSHGESLTPSGRVFSPTSPLFSSENIVKNVANDPFRNFLQEFLRTFSRDSIRNSFTVFFFQRCFPVFLKKFVRIFHHEPFQGLWEIYLRILLEVIDRICPKTSFIQKYPHIFEDLFKSFSGYFSLYFFVQKLCEVFLQGYL